MNQGDRLAFSNGILVLSVLAGVLLVVFGGDTHALHPALHDRRVRLVHAVAGRHGASTGGRCASAGLADERASINGFGALVTGIVLRHRRGHEGARRRVDHPAADPDARASSSRSTRRHYDQRRVRADAAAAGAPQPRAAQHVVLVPIGGMQRAVVEALRYARDAVGRCAGGLRGRRSRGDRAAAERLGRRGASGVAAGRARRRRTAR